ncbi:MAG: hypothetical protein QMC67_09000 [Candidatus Wallbacteria bacterium]
MKNLKSFLFIIIIFSFLFLIPGVSRANDCSLCGKKIYIGSQCTGCTFNQFVNKLNHPCKICGERIFFGKICKNCKGKQTEFQKNNMNPKIQNQENIYEYSKNSNISHSKSGEENNDISNNQNGPDSGKKVSPGNKIWNSIKTSANNAYKTIFGTNKHE